MLPEQALGDRLALITSRHSIAPRRLRSPGPTTAEVEAMVAAALTAPDHGGLRPWRIIQIADDGREQLAEVFVAARRLRSPDATPAMLQRDRDKALNAPVLLVVCARPRPDIPGVPPYEQLIAVGAAVQNLLLAAHGLGYGASLLSGEKARDPLVRRCLGVDSDEIIVGFLSIGSIAELAPVRPQPDAGARVTVWHEPSPRLADGPRDQAFVAGSSLADTSKALPL